MARPKTQENLSASVLSGSEETFDFFCQPCSTEKHVEAVGYCQQCSEYLCDTCCSYHGRFAAFKQHKVLDKSSMPRTKPPITSRSQDVLTETCKDHPDKILEYYCNGHGKLCCSVCITLNHTSCLDKSYIPDISSGIADSQECKSLKAKLHRLAGVLSKQMKNANDQVQSNDRYLSDAYAEMKRFRKYVNELLDKFEKDTKELMAKLHQENTELATTNSEQCARLLFDINRLSTDIDTNATMGNSNKLFVQMKQSACFTEEIQCHLEEITLCSIKQLSFQPDEAFQQMESTLFSLWSIAEKQVDTPTQSRYVRKVCVKSEDDTGECTISSITVLTGGRAVVTDLNNCAVKLIDIKMDKIITSLSLSSGPFFAAYMSPTNIAVVLPSKISICTVTTSEALTETRVINTPNAEIVGICYDGSNFIAACQCPASVQIIDMSGTTLSTIATNSDGQQLFTLPRHIALGRDKDIVYVTDKMAHTVTCMTTKGRVIWIFQHEKLRCPWGVAVGRDDSVYVCSYLTDTVYQLSATGGFIRILLRQRQGLVSFPQAISYDEEGDRLCISTCTIEPEKRNYIRLYKL